MRSDEGLTIKKYQLSNYYQWPNYVINSIDNTKLPCYTLHQHSTIVSLEISPVCTSRFSPEGDLRDGCMTPKATK